MKRFPAGSAPVLSRFSRGIRALTAWSCVCRCLALVALAVLAAPQASALSDHLTINTSNPITGGQVTMELDRYNLRAPNWEFRIYDNPNHYTVVPAAQVPEPTTYRGRTSDGGMVCAGVRPNGLMYARVNYGCHWGSAGWNDAQYEGANRWAWTAPYLALPAGETVTSGGYVYQAAANAMTPAPAPPAGWYNNLGATTNFGGPTPYNNLQTMPVSMSRIVVCASDGAFAQYGGSIATALANMEQYVNECDYCFARDAGVALRIEAEGIEQYAGVYPETKANFGNVGFDIMYWVADWAVSGGNFAMTYPSDMDAAQAIHELGHSMGGPDFPQEWDYAGNQWNTMHVLDAPDMCGRDLAPTLSHRGQAGHYLNGGGYWYYNTPVPTRANPDYASTNVNTPVDVDVLLNDWNVNTTNRADLAIDSVQNPSDHGGTVVNLGGGIVRYTPAAGFRGDDLFRYYVKDKSGNFKSLTGVRILVVDPNNPLIGHYTLDETTGAYAHDSSGASGGSRQGGLVLGGTFDAKHTSGVGSTNGYGAVHLDLGVWNQNSLTFGGPAGSGDAQAGYCYDAMDRSQSVSLWYKPDSAVDGGRRYLWTKNAAVYDEGSGVIIGYDASRFFIQVWMNGQFGAPVTVSADVGPTVAQMWYHVVGEIDRENQQVHLYVNGRKFSSASNSLAAGQFVVGQNCANLGACNSGISSQGWYQWGYPWSGSYDDLRIYTKALSATEVSALYTAPGLLPANVISPAVAATGVDVKPLLQWGPGRPDYQHDVYVGTDAAQVAAATTGSAGIYLGRSSSPSWQISNALAYSQTYYWRIDEVDGTNIGTGTVWQFATRPVSAECSLLTMNWGSWPAVVTGTNVALTVPYGTDLTTLNPTCTLSPYATVSPASASTHNFTSPVNYTVTAEGGAPSTSYRVTVYQGAAPGTILSIPPGLQPGDTFRLAFVSSTDRNALSGDLADYNGFVSDLAVQTPGLFSLNTTWKAIVTLWGLNAIDNTLTRGTDPSAPIYRVDGFRVASSNADLWDGSIILPISTTEAGGTRNSLVWTGTVRSGVRGADYAIPNFAHYSYVGNCSSADYSWVEGLGIQNGGQGYPFYAISGVLTVPATRSECNLLAFQWGGYTAVINGTNVALTVPYGTDVTTLNPTFTISPFATVTPASGGAHDFSSPVNYMVKAVDGVTSKIYRVTVSVLPPSQSCDLLSLNWGNYSGVINGTNVSLLVPSGTAVTTLDPACTASEFATISPASGSTVDFTRPVTYTVTAQDQIHTKSYLVSVLVGPRTLPPGLQPGDKYRLAFVTGGKTNATSQTIADYNAFVAAAASAAPALNALGTTWKCLGSTSATSAVTNTLTGSGNPTAAIYNLAGGLVASGNTALWSGSITAPISIAETGGTLNTDVWSGNNAAGWPGGDWFLGDTGGSWVYYGTSTATGANWIGSVGGHGKGEALSLYGISAIITVPANGCDLLTFDWGANHGVISGTNVHLNVPPGTPLTNLNPTYTIAPFATSSPASGTARNFTTPQDYTVTAADGTTKKTYHVTVTAYSSACDMLGMSLGSNNAAIDGTTVTLFVPGGTPLTSLNPSYTVSLLASGAPASGTARDFTTPQDYTITAQDGITSKTYRVAVVPGWRYASWTGDADSGIDSAFDYSVAVDCGGGGATVNGVPFQAHATSGTNFLIGGGVAATSGSSNISGTSKALADNFIYNGSPRTVTLSNLTPGVMYETSFFAYGWDASGRTQTFAAGGDTLSLDQDAYGQNNGIRIWYTFVADASGSKTFTITPTGIGTFHLSALANRQATSSKCDLLALSWGSNDATISGTNVALAVPNRIVLTNLNPTFTASTNATVFPPSGSLRDFTTPQSYTVTAQDGVHSKTYLVTASAPTTSGLVWSDNFNVADTGNLDTAATAGRLSGPLAGTVFLRSALALQTIAGNQLSMVAGTSSGRVRFQDSNGWYNWAAGTQAASILAAGGLRVEFDWTPTSTTTDQWVSFNIGHSGVEPAMRVNDGQTDYGILFRGNGGTQRFDNGAGTTTTSFAAGAGAKHVVLNFGFMSFADGSPVTARVTVDGVQVDSYSFTWNNNGGALYMELETLVTGMKIDNYSVSIPVTPNTYATWAAANAGGQGAGLDSNKNGIPNAIEYFMGATAAKPGRMPALVNTNGVVSWTWPYDSTAVATYKFQLSDDLSGWSDVTPPDSRITALANPNLLRLTLPPGAATKFCRLVVVPAP